MNNSQFPPEIRFDFPCARPQSGIAMGNGALEIAVWGDEFLCLTITRAGSWNDNETDFAKDATAARLLELLEADDEAGVKALFASSLGGTTRRAGEAHLKLRFADEARPLVGTLKPDGSLEIVLRGATGAERTISIECSMDEEVAWLDGANEAQWSLRSSWREDHQIWEDRGFDAPLEIEIDGGSGLICESPEGDSLAIIVRARGQQLFIATALDETEAAAKAAVSLARGKPDINPIYHWKQHWRTAPRVAWPNERLQKLWNVALFRQARTESPIDFIVAFTALLVTTQGETISVAPTIPPGWREFSFDSVVCKEKFLLGADIENGAVIQVRVQCEEDGILRLLPNAQTRIERAMEAGETWVWQAS